MSIGLVVVLAALAALWRFTPLSELARPERVAELRGQSLEQVARRSSANASKLFALPYQPHAEPAGIGQEG